MEVGDSFCLAVADTSQVGEARRQAARLAQRLGFDEASAGKVALVVTELAGNLTKHSRGGGEVVVRMLDHDGIEVLALDRAPGMGNLAQAMRDGYSTAGTPGTGLGAVMRAAEVFDIHSAPGVGTAIAARIWSRSAPRPRPATMMELGVVSLPKTGEQICGDGWAVEERDGRTTLMVVDGLGHGPGAAQASREAERVFRERPGLPPTGRIEAIHEALRSTRGAAVAVAEIDHEGGVVRYAGVGNISGTVLAGEEARSMVSQNGTAGLEIRRVQQFDYPWPAGSPLLVMHSDGLLGRWSLDRYPGLTRRHPALVAGVLYRDFTRGRDDVTVAVAGTARAGGPAPSA